MSTHISLGLFVVFVFQYIFRIIYRLWFSPLAGFPGPKLAAVTSLFEFYFDFLKQGKYCFKIEQMHEAYGPIVRINPKELSIVDSNFYDKVYVSGNTRKTQGYSQFASGIGFDGMVRAEKHIKKLIEEKKQLKVTTSEPAIRGQSTLFRYMIHESGLPEADLTVERLTKEAQILLGAGSVSTARTLHFIIFYLSKNPSMRERLEEELKDTLAGRPGEWPTWSKLEKLPYLQALIKEGLRYTQLWHHASTSASVARRGTALYERTRWESLEDPGRGK
ncbi:MAG: hypothetical protein Q9160_005100 [Pyrenula sp. 1 TL-2023]